MTWLARWSARDPEVVTITDGNGGESQQLLLVNQPPGDRPVPGMLLTAGWTAYPGSEWRQEGPEDTFECAVYPS